ncbi:hypothetical protein FRC10_008338 [Ceratobasidium sp. 414]|nr:hypothetical protein FRC10_008338 [Ceratobasidium sp. 414]
MSTPQGASNNAATPPQPVLLAAPASSLTGSLYGLNIANDAPITADPPPPFPPLNSTLMGLPQVLPALGNGEDARLVELCMNY